MSQQTITPVCGRSETFGYPPEFHPKDPMDQLKLLELRLPLSVNVRQDARSFIMHELSKVHLPDRTSWFLVPRPSLLERTEHQAMILIMGLINEHLVQKGEKGEDYFNSFFGAGGIERSGLRKLQHTEEVLTRISEMQNGDILFVPLQLGLVYQGQSPAEARELFGPHECGITSYVALVSLYTHPERFAHPRYLDLDIAGEECRVQNGGSYLHCPVLSKREKMLCYGPRNITIPRSGFGSGSIVVPMEWL